MDRTIGHIKTIFPNIKQDKDFKLTSPVTGDYNCLAWANEWNDRWMWPNTDNHVPEPDEYWPEGIPNDEKPETFINAFKSLGFSQCDTSEYEEEYLKIALYKSDYIEKATHAARLLPTGKWTSKLGDWQDIQHGTPQSLEGDFYGHVYCYMKRKINIL